VSKVTLLLGDCLELMRDLPAGSMDAVIDNNLPIITACNIIGCKGDCNHAGKSTGALRKLPQQPDQEALVGQSKITWIITDPPYGLNFRGNNWDSAIPEWLSLAFSITPNVAFTTAPTTVWDYPKPDWVNCWYRAGSTSRTAQGGFNHWTPILIYGRFKFPVDTFVTAAALTGMKNKGIDHPSPKDPDLMAWLVVNLTTPGDTILDPFMGSGTTGVACVQTGRNFIGMEIDPGYFEIARRRIEQAQAQMRMPL
jgi:hypothetical protein